MATAPSQLRIDAERLEGDGFSDGLPPGWIDDYEELWRERDALRRRVERLEAQLRGAATSSERRPAGRRRPKAVVVFFHLVFAAFAVLALASLVAMVAIVGGFYELDAKDSPSASTPSAASVERSEPQASDPPPGAVADAARPGRDHKDVAASSPPTLRLTAAHGESWLRVREDSATGKVLFEGVLAPGRSKTLRGDRFALRVGAPENLEAELDGEALRLPPGTADVVIEADDLRVVSVD